jgi:hypothetical protein
LSPEASVVLRDQLLAELEALALDDLDAWTLRAWPRANGRTAEDGDEVRVAFQVRLGSLQTVPDEDVSRAKPDQPVADQEIQIQCEESTAPDPALPVEVCEVIEIFQSRHDGSGQELERCFLR